MRLLALICSGVVLSGCGQDHSYEPRRRMLGLIGGRPLPQPVLVDEPRFQEAKNLVRSGKWADAKKLLEQVQAENPSFGDGAVEQYLARTEREIAVSAELSRAEEALALHQYVNAARALKRIDVSDTLQSNRVGLVRAGLDAAAQTMVEAGFTRMRGPKTKVEMEQLRDLAANIAELDPENRDAPVMAAFAEQALKELQAKERRKLRVDSFSNEPY